MSSFLPSEIIKKKRDQRELSRDEIKFFVDGFVSGEIPDYQMSALLMSIFIRGLNKNEASWLTEVMTHSGDLVKFSGTHYLPVDKHSTGGVGDKASLILAPIVAACGVPVPMIAGRGLGHTGGTLDKLEAIPGFNIKLSLNEFKSQVEKHNLCVMGQTEKLCPADRKMYQLRDVTATVECIPLICASILSKKIAEGTKALVMDIKYGSGAFMKSIDQAKELGLWLKAIAENNDLKFKALITNMNQPLGLWAGNAVEIKESIDILQGNSVGSKDTLELSLRLAAEMLVLSNYSSNINEAEKKCKSILESGKAYESFELLCRHQGGRLNELDLPKQSLPVLADSSGYIESFDTEKIGVAGILIKAGRQKASDHIDHLSGIYFHKKIGDPIEKEEPVFTLWGRSREIIQPGFDSLKSSVTISLKKSPIPRLIELEL